MTAAAQRTPYEHIVVDEHGVPWITGANTKVVELVAEVRAYGWSPEELAFQHPHLGLGQIHSALAYYWDHRDAIDADLARRNELIERIGSSANRHPAVARLAERLANR